MSKAKSYAESVLFQCIISLSGGPCTPDTFAALSESYIARLSGDDVPKTVRNLLADVKAFLATLIEKNNGTVFSHEMWANKQQCLLILITELYSDVVAWNAVEQYISASTFLQVHEEKRAFYHSQH